jgi:hypothetical protein
VDGLFVEKNTTKNKVTCNRLLPFVIQVLPLCYTSTG